MQGNYFPLLFYAVNGYTNKEIASALKISEPTVNKKFGEMYDLANVKNKNELINLYKITFDIKIMKK